MKKYALILICVLLWGFQIVQGQTMISGTVTSASDGSVLAGATIAVPGTTAGTISGEDGTYSLSVPSRASLRRSSFSLSLSSSCFL